MLGKGLRKVLRYFAYVLLLGMAGILVLLYFMFGTRIGGTGTECGNAPFSSVDSCKGDSSGGFQSSGWWYNIANGRLNEQACKKLHSGTIEISVDFYKEPIRTLQKIDCSILEKSQENECFGLQGMPPNGNTRHYFLLISDKACTKSVYFEGSKVMYLNDEPKILDTWTTPYIGIPDYSERN